MYVSDGELNGIALTHAKESILPERAHATDFQRRAKAPSRLLQIDFRKPISHRLKRRPGDHRRAIAVGIVWHALCYIPHGDLPSETTTEPCPGRREAPRERERPRRDIFPTSDRQRNRADLRREYRANQMHRGRALAVDATPVRRIERPHTIQFQAPSRPDATLGHGDTIKRLDRMQTNFSEMGAVSHRVSLVRHADVTPRGYLELQAAPLDFPWAHSGPRREGVRVPSRSVMSRHAEPVTAGRHARGGGQPPPRTAGPYPSRVSRPPTISNRIGNCDASEALWVTTIRMFCWR